ncbi:MAG: M15 family metallopeptidase, partial [Eubacteriales bacterium]
SIQAEPTPSPTPSPSEANLTAWVVTDSFYSIVNIRKTPDISDDDSILPTFLHDRDEVLCTGESSTDSEGNTWVEIVIDQGTGYVLADFLVQEQPKSVPEALNEGVLYDGVFTQLVPVESLSSNIIIDLTLADENNFISDYASDPSVGALYSHEIALIQYTTGLKLAAAAQKFSQDGYQLVLWDAYRPYSVTVAMYDVINDPKLIADPSKGSKHNRGAAVDVTLYKDGEMVNMPTDDRVMDVSAASRTSYMSTEQREMMDYLTDVMTSCGFSTYRNEWWHFNDSDWGIYPLMDFPLSLFTGQ